MTIGEYRTLRASKVADLDKMVNEALADGFQLYGDPHVVGGDNQFEIFQAVVKEARGKTSVVELGGR